MFQGFKQFIVRGNVVDLAIGVVMGVAFNGVISALVKDLFTPFIAAIVGKPNFASLVITFNHNSFLVGDFINALLAFIINAFIIYFAVVIPLNKLASLKGNKSPTKTTKSCPECLSEIPLLAKRCAFCTAHLSSRK